jgi:putative transposase
VANRATRDIAKALVGGGRVTTRREKSKRRRPMRWRGYDYSKPGMYFVTVCTAKRASLFGGVLDGKMWVNDAGQAIEAVWSELPRHYGVLETDAFIVMPNHVHGIIILHRAEDKFALIGAGSPRPVLPSGSPGIKKGAVTAPLPVTLGKAVAFFKYETTKRLNAANRTPGAHLWQRNYYEHVIRDGDSLDRIRRYIADNPARWAFDRENPYAVCPEEENA